MNRLARLLEPKSVAVIGGRPAELAIEQCRRLEFEGELWAVHPTRSELAGVVCVPTVNDLPGAPDAAFVAVNRHATVEVVGLLAAKGAGAAVCHASGFSEAGPDGVELQRSLELAAKGMPVVGPNCYGTVSATTGAALWPDQQGLRRVERGVALVTQSGNIGLDLTLQTRPMPIAHVLTLGNQALVGIEEFVEALVNDSAVTAVGLHLEALHDVPRFVAACHKASAVGKPVVVLKTGASELGAQIAASHTSSIVGSDAAYEALFKRLGVRRVRSIPELLDVLHVLDRLGGLTGRQIVSLSCSGGEASIVADLCDPLDLEFSDFRPQRAGRIRAALGDSEKAKLVSVSNPFDYHTFIWGDQERLSATFTAALSLDDDQPDAALLVLDFPRGDLDDKSWWLTLEAFADAVATTGTPGVVAASMAENMPAAVESAAVKRGLVPVRGISEALGSLEAAQWWGRRKLGTSPWPAEAVSGPVGILSEDRSKEFLAKHGVPLPEWSVVSAADAPVAASAIGFPVVVKAIGLAHKTDVGGIFQNLTDRLEVGSAVNQMVCDLGVSRVLVEEQIEDTVAELLVNVRREDPVGWLLTVGTGGTLVEVSRDTASLLLPATDIEILDALQSLVFWPLLAGHRGRLVADVEAVVAAVQQIALAATTVDGLVELEVNPLLAGAQGVTVVDALVLMARP